MAGPVRLSGRKRTSVSVLPGFGTLDHQAMGHLVGDPAVAGPARHPMPNIMAHEYGVICFRQVEATS
jgi:hypothetical protein